MLLFLLLPSLALASRQPSQGSNDTPLESVCGLEAASTELRLLETLRPCEKPVDCAAATACVSAVLAELTKDSECAESGVFCNRAGTALVLVETLRRLAEAVLREGAAACPESALLGGLIAACHPEEVDAGTAEYYAAMKVDPRGMIAYQSLMRSVGDNLRKEEGIASEMRWVEEQRLWRGAQAIAFSFGCPGLVALISPSHLGLVVAVEILGAVVMVVYVWLLHGPWLAFGSLSVCGGVFIAQAGLLLIRRRLLSSPEERDHCPASPRESRHRHDN